MLEDEKTLKYFKRRYALLDIAEERWKKENPDDWEICKYGDNMKAIGINTYICTRTLYGDWSCTTFETETNNIIGQFCADAGLVAVFLLDEVLKYNPGFNYHIENPHTTTLIKDFDGDIEFDIDTNTETVKVIGKGNINFYTEQTGY
jgi:hypothetical protein